MRSSATKSKLNLMTRCQHPLTGDHRKAYGANANRPIPVRVGDEEQTLMLGNDVSTTTLRFNNPTRSNTLVIVPPEPESTNEGIFSATLHVNSVSGWWKSKSLNPQDKKMRPKYHGR